MENWTSIASMRSRKDHLGNRQNSGAAVLVFVLILKAENHIGDVRHQKLIPSLCLAATVTGIGPLEKEFWRRSKIGAARGYPGSHDPSGPLYLIVPCRRHKIG